MASGRYSNPVVTPIRAAGTLYVAEEYHQDYTKKNPIRYNFYRYGSGRDQYLNKTWGKDIKVDYRKYTDSQNDSLNGRRSTSWVQALGDWQ